LARNLEEIYGDVLITGSLNVLEGINDTDLSEVQATERAAADLAETSLDITMMTFGIPYVAKRGLQTINEWVR